MILVYGRSDDPPTLATLEAVRDAGGEVVFADQRCLAGEGITIAHGPGGITGTLVIAGQRIALEQVTGVFVRPLDPDVSGLDREEAARVARMHELLAEWLDVARVRVVNRPGAMQANASKPLQLQLIGEAGFPVPATLVTSDPDEVLDFWKLHDRVIYKSASGIRSIVRELDDTSASRLSLLTRLPVQFQAYVPGVDVRVHVIGLEAYAAEVRSGGIDYRYAERDGQTTQLEATALPMEVASKCVALAASMDLALAGIDLRRTPDGEYVCFEVNPMPAYTYFEVHTGLPIANALARFLVRGDAGGKESTHGAGHREPDTYRRHHRRAAASSYA